MKKELFEYKLEIIMECGRGLSVKEQVKIWTTARKAIEKEYIHIKCTELGMEEVEDATI